MPAHGVALALQNTDQAGGDRVVVLDDEDRLLIHARTVSRGSRFDLALTCPYSRVTGSSLAWPPMSYRLNGGPMRKISALITAAIAVAVAGCGSSSSSSSAARQAPPRRAAGVNPNQRESLPPGDIPDTVAYVPYTAAGLGLTVSTPEGWSRANAAGAVKFTDKLNEVQLFTVPAGRPLDYRLGEEHRAAKARLLRQGVQAPIHQHRLATGRPGRTHRLPRRLET